MTFGAISVCSAAEQSIGLASTTSVEASGLSAKNLPQFTAKTGIAVNVVAQGTGKALDTARRGDADVLLIQGGCSASTQPIYVAAIIAVVARIGAAIEPLHSLICLKMNGFGRGRLAREVGRIAVINPVGRLA